jgi:hypothetical protein
VCVSTISTRQTGKQAYLIDNLYKADWETGLSHWQSLQGRLGNRPISLTISTRQTGKQAYLIDNLYKADWETGLSHWHKYSHLWVNACKNHHWQWFLCFVQASFFSLCQLGSYFGLTTMLLIHPQFSPVTPIKLCYWFSWLLIIAWRPFSRLAIDFQANLSQSCNEATREHSMSSW